MSCSLAIDVGKARIGVSTSDASGILASPRDFIAREPERDALSALVALAAETRASRVFVGYPLNLKGQHTESTRDALAFARSLEEAISAAKSAEVSGLQDFIEVRLIDERFSTTRARARLISAGRSTKDTKHQIDSAAAFVILQEALDFENAHHRVAGLSLRELLADG